METKVKGLSEGSGVPDNWKSENYGRVLLTVSLTKNSLSNLVYVNSK